MAEEAHAAAAGLAAIRLVSASLRRRGDTHDGIIRGYMTAVAEEEQPARAESLIGGLIGLGQFFAVEAYGEDAADEVDRQASRIELDMLGQAEGE
jgi:hypothetical protein